MEKDYNEILCQAIDTIVTHRLKEVVYDKTIICEIVNDTDKDIGHYIVTDGTIKFDAYSESTRYKNKDQVYVIIPQGDFSQQKIILSKYTVDNKNNPITYVAPLGSVVAMTDNLISNSINEGILANGETTTKLIWSSNLREDPNSTLDIQNNGIYTTLGLRADFKCLLSDKFIREGNYGLRLDLFSDSTTDSSEEYLVSSVYLDTIDMFGDPYSFTAPFQQEKKFDISSLSTIWGMNLYLYQKKNFKYYDESTYELKDVPTTYKIGNTEYPLDDNIFVSDIYLIFGNDVSKIADNTFEIYTNNPLSYSQLKTEDEGYNFKNIYSIWYNKNEDNEFLGFSDGVVDESYDEDAYFKEYEESMQGATLQNVEEGVPRLKETLQIYANAEEINKQCQEMFNKLDRELNSILNSLDDTLKAYDTNVNFETNITGATGSLTLLIETISAAAILKKDIDDTSVPAVTLYKDWVKSCGEVYDQLLKDENSTAIIPNFPTNLDHNNSNSYYNKGKSRWNRLKEDLDNLYNKTLQTIIETRPATQASIDKSLNLYKQWLKNAELVTNKLTELYLNQFIQRESLIERFNNKNLKSFDEEYQEFIDKHANKYCIYWYRYEFGYEDPNERYLKPNWRRMEYPKDINGNIILPKPGMPAVQMNNTYAKKSEVGYTGIEMNYQVEADKFKAILFFNHTPYISNEIIFENDEEIIDGSVGDLANALHIELGKNAQDSYQLYGTDNRLVNAADGVLNRELRVRYDGIKEKDEALINTWVYWYVPKNASMLTYDDKLLYNNGFMYLDPEDENLKEYLSNYKEGYTCFFKKINSITETLEDGTEQISLDVSDTYFYFLIEKYYSPTAMNNEIICRVVKNQNHYEAEKFFTFSSFGTSGTDYTLSIIPATSQTALINVSSREVYPLELKATFYDYNNEPVHIEEAPEIRWSWIKPYKGLAIEETDKLNHRIINGTLAKDGASQCLYNVLECEAYWNKLTEDTEADQTIVLKTYYPVPFSTGHYYIEGASTIVYDDLGKNPTYYKGPYKIYNHGTNTEITDVTWEMYYYVINNESTGNGIQRNPDDTAKKYLPTISYQIFSENQEDSNSYKNGYYLKPLNMYIDNLDYYPVVVCKRASQIIWAQPIFITQNRYGSSTLNSWDESLTIDEENGIILSTMMGAGYKDEENRFHGVVMGDVRTVLDDNNVDHVGLYGFHEGAQSFGFRSDGTAFLGKSGLGRILFDGNYGFIYSGNWLNSFDDREEKPFKTGENGEITLNSGTAGMAIDLQSGHLDAYDFKVTSKNVYLNSNPEFTDDKIGYYFRLGNDGRSIDHAYSDEDLTPTKGFMSLDTDGNLILRASNLYLTSLLGGTNLLRQTSPRKMSIVTTKRNVNVVDEKDGPFDSNPTTSVIEQNVEFPVYDEETNQVKCDWKLDQWIIGENTALTVTENIGGEKPYYLEMTVKNQGFISQEPKLHNDTEYTLSGYIRAQSGATFNLTLIGDEVLASNLQIIYANLDNDTSSNNIGSFAINDDKWHYFKCTFRTGGKDIELKNKVIVKFECNANFYLWHAKLEKGSIATDWSAAPEDIEENTLGLRDQYDYYLKQDTIFEKLFTDPETGLLADGIRLIDGSQTLSGRPELYINATYIATGILRSKNWDGVIKSVRLEDGTYSYEILEHPTSGMYIDLDNQKIWAASFELNAWNGKGLYLNSNPIADADSPKNCYLRMGNSSEYIYFKENGEFKIKAYNFIFDAFESDEANGGPYGIYMNSNPTGDAHSYFRINADADNEIKFRRLDEGGAELSIKSNNFSLKAGTGSNTITINSGADTYPLKIGNNFKVSWNGTLISLNGQFSGSISGSSFSGGSLEVGTSEGYLKVNKKLTHPEVSGLNVMTEAGINLSKVGGIGDCTNIGGPGGKGVFWFTDKGINTESQVNFNGPVYFNSSQRVQLSSIDLTYIYAAGLGGYVKMRDYVNNAVEELSGGNSFPGGAEGVIVYNNTAFYFKNGLLVDTAPNIY